MNRIHDLLYTFDNNTVQEYNAWQIELKYIPYKKKTNSNTNSLIHLSVNSQ